VADAMSAAEAGFWRGVALPGAEDPGQLFIFLLQGSTSGSYEEWRIRRTNSGSFGGSHNLILFSCRQSVLPLCSNAITPDAAATLVRSCSPRLAAHAAKRRKRE
jgi:hypothetical protein